MSKVEEIHYKAVMAADNQEPPKDYAISAHADHFNGFVEGFVEGYHQAEKDIVKKVCEWLDNHTMLSEKWYIEDLKKHLEGKV
jgi:nitrogenase molybdenum-iron protein alpha/beta subunit